MKTLRLMLTALVLSVLTEMPVPERAHDSVSGADVPTVVRGG
jgi:hypothetical protein